MSEQVFNHSAHRELWGWLAENPDKENDEWPGWVYNGGTYPKVVADCFCCDYATWSSPVSENFCHHCPLISGESVCENVCLHGLYREWLEFRKADDYHAAKVAALKIRELPVREGVRCE